MFIWNRNLKAENQRLRESMADLRSDLNAVVSEYSFGKPGLKNNRLLQTELAAAESTIIKIKAIVDQSGN